MSRYYTQAPQEPAMDDPDFEERSTSPRRGYGGSSVAGGGYGAYGGQNAGYPQQPPAQGEYETGFDVRADFDGDGPRWSEMHGVAKQETYRPVYDHVPPSGEAGTIKPALQYQQHDPEMVSVPVLGPEWTKEELHNQSRRGKTDIVQDKRKTAWRAWNRDQRGCCGIKWLTRRVFVFLAFFVIVAVVLMCYFMIPRPATWAFYDPEPFVVDNTTVSATRIPANFTFGATLQLIADGSASYLPIQYSDAKATIMDQETLKVIGVGHLGRYKLKNKKDQPVRFPIRFSYVAMNVSDPTWSHMYEACQFAWPGVVRTALRFRLEVQQNIVGLTNTPVSVTEVSGVNCPFDFGDQV